MSESSPKSVNIRPKVTVLSVLAHLEYKPWFALAEFVDNAIQSFQDRKAQIAEVDGRDPHLRVDIEVDHGLQRIQILDNAGGIAPAEFPRAFRPAEVPPNRTGLAEFGMGMKTASCWFSPLWRVRTSALGDGVERTVTFDIDEIVHDQLEELLVEERDAPEDTHYTVIELERVRSIPTGRTSGKIKEHLTDIYREFIRAGELELVYRGERLKYTEPGLLFAPSYSSDNEPTGEPLQWRKPIDFDFGLGLRVRGYAALRATGSTRYAGFSLFRRRRVIEGSADEKYRPQEIFGAPNSFVSQRLFGELHLEGFSVSHTKDGFRWDENEDDFLQLLREHLDSEDLPLLRQARNYRESAAKATKPAALEGVVRETVDTLSRYGPDDMRAIRDEGPADEAPPAEIPDTTLLADRMFEIDTDGSVWQVWIQLSGDHASKEWLAIAESPRIEDGATSPRTLRLRIGLENSFMRRFVRLDEPEHLEPIVRIAAGLGLSEHLGRMSGLKRAGEIRRNLNRLLSGSLARRKSGS